MLCGASLDRCPLSRRKWSISLGCEPQIGDCLISRSLNILRKLPPDLSSSHGSCGNCCLCNRWWTCIFKGDGGIVEPLNWICRHGYFPASSSYGIGTELHCGNVWPEEMKLMNCWTAVVCGKQKFQWDVKQKVELSSAFIRPQPQGDQLTAHFNWSMKLSKVFYGSCSLKSTKASSNLNSFVSSSSNQSIFGHDNALSYFSFAIKALRKASQCFKEKSCNKLSELWH